MKSIRKTKHHWRMGTVTKIYIGTTINAAKGLKGFCIRRQVVVGRSRHAKIVLRKQIFACEWQDFFALLGRGRKSHCC